MFSTTGKFQRSRNLEEKSMPITKARTLPAREISLQVVCDSKNAYQPSLRLIVPRDLMIGMLNEPATGHCCIAFLILQGRAQGAADRWLEECAVTYQWNEMG